VLSCPRRPDAPFPLIRNRFFKTGIRPPSLPTRPFPHKTLPPLFAATGFACPKREQHRGPALINFALLRPIVAHARTTGAIQSLRDQHLSMPAFSSRTAPADGSYGANAVPLLENLPSRRHSRFIPLSFMGRNDLRNRNTPRTITLLSFLTSLRASLSRRNVSPPPKKSASTRRTLLGPSFPFVGNLFSFFLRTKSSVRLFCLALLFYSLFPPKYEKIFSSGSSPPKD